MKQFDCPPMSQFRDSMIFRLKTFVSGYGSKVYAVNAIKGALAVCNAIFAAKILGLKSYGTVVTLLALVGMVQAFVETRNSEAFVIFSNRCPNEGASVRRAAIITDIVSAFSLVIVMLIVSVMAGNGAMPQVVPQGAGAEIVLVITVYGCTQLLRGTITGIFIQNDSLHRIGLVGVGEEILKTVGLIVLTAGVDRSAFGFACVLAISASLMLMVAFVQAATLSASWRDELQPAAQGEIFKASEYARFNTNAFISTALKAFHSRVDVILMSYGFGVANAGALDIAKKIVLPLSFVMAPIANLTLKSAIGAAVCRKQLAEKMRRYNVISWRIAMCYFAVATAGVLIVSFAMGRVFDERTVGAVLVLLASCIGYTMWWARNFSNLSSQRYSIAGNAFAALYMCTVSYQAARSQSIGLYTLSLAGLSAALAAFWLLVLKRENNRS
ncbi:hypothetical protein [Thermomonas brevis]